MSIIKNFKSLPKKSKGLLVLGITIGLFVALPLFVWSLVNMKFDVRKRAQEVTPPTPKIVKVLVLEFNPILTTQENKKLSVFKNWNVPIDLEANYIQELKIASNNYADYQINQRIEIDGFPKLNDDFTYTENTYLDCLDNNLNCHDPWLVDYNKIIDDYDICGKVNTNEIDEVWLWGGPWFGYWEAVMTGPGAFITNAPPIINTTCNRQLHVMGFNYERGVPEMLEDFGHRFEGTMYHAFTENGIDLWTGFTKYELTNPGDASCGKIHFPPNATADYDWANMTSIENGCEDWIKYPNLTGEKETFNCQKWGCTALGWIKYWLNHIPKYSSYTNNTWDNWWKYVLDYENAITSSPSPSPTEMASPTETATPTDAPIGGGDPNYCGGTCGSNFNCRANFFCYQGYCRNPLCSNDSNCDCIEITPTATATATSTTRPTSTTKPIFTAKGSIKPTPTYTSSTGKPLFATDEPVSVSDEKNKPENMFFAKYAFHFFAGFVVIVILTIYFAVRNKKQSSIPHISPPTNI